MQQSKAGRRLARGAVGVTVTVCGAVTGLAVPAYAGGTTAGHQGTGVSDTSRFKQQTVACPQGQRVLGTGGRVNNGQGAVVLTHVVPDPTLSFVVVGASAAAGYAGRWSITAIAVCAESPLMPDRVAATSQSPSATAECPSGRLSGTGFRIDDPTGGSYLTELSVDADQQRVRAGIGGTSPATVTAIGICLPPYGPIGSPRASVAFDGSWPKSATVKKDPAYSYVYGVGGRVTGADDVFLDGLVPDPEGDRATVHAVRVASATGPARLAGAAGEGSVTSEALCGTFY